MSEKQVKSKQRVADHGEVFTAEREVKAMCDLVDLEMALEDGNKTLAKEKANAIEAVKDLLSQEYLERYEALAKKI